MHIHAYMKAPIHIKGNIKLKTTLPSIPNLKEMGIRLLEGQFREQERPAL